MRGFETRENRTNFPNKKIAATMFRSRDQNALRKVCETTPLATFTGTMP